MHTWECKDFWTRPSTATATTFETSGWAAADPSSSAYSLAGIAGELTGIRATSIPTFVKLIAVCLDVTDRAFSLPHDDKGWTCRVDTGLLKRLYHFECWLQYR